MQLIEAPLSIKQFVTDCLKWTAIKFRSSLEVNSILGSSEHLLVRDEQSCLPQCQSLFLHFLGAMVIFVYTVYLMNKNLSLQIVAI